MTTATDTFTDVYGALETKTYKILWFADAERGQIWNEHWCDERDAWADKHQIAFWGHGRHEKFSPGYSARKVADTFFGSEGPDLVVFGCWYLCLPPNDAGDLDCPKVCFIEDNYNQCHHSIAEYVERYRIDCLWHRYYTGLSELLDTVTQRVGYEPRTIAVPWAVDPDVFQPITVQPHDVSIMGQATRRYYPVRNQVFQAIRQSDLSHVHRPHPTAFRPRGHRQAAIPGAVTGAAYAEALASAKVGITTGGHVGYAIARVFELPAVGSAMLCPSFWELERRGFKEGVHFLELDADKPVEQVKALLEDEEKRQRLMQMARALVVERHTWESRVIDTIAAMESKGLL